MKKSRTFLALVLALMLGLLAGCGAPDSAPDKSNNDAPQTDTPSQTTPDAPSGGGGKKRL